MFLWKYEFFLLCSNQTRGILSSSSWLLDDQGGHQLKTRCALMFRHTFSQTCLDIRDHDNLLPEVSPNSQWQVEEVLHSREQLCLNLGPQHTKSARLPGINQDKLMPWDNLLPLLMEQCQCRYWFCYCIFIAGHSTETILTIHDNLYCGAIVPKCDVFGLIDPVSSTCYQ